MDHELCLPFAMISGPLRGLVLFQSSLSNLSPKVLFQRAHLLGSQSENLRVLGEARRAIFQGVNTLFMAPGLLSRDTFNFPN